MRQLQAVTVTHLAGYKEISWRGLRPTENLLVGRNGSGKSSLLEAIVIGLNFLHGKRSGDLLTGANQDARIQFTFADGSRSTLTLGEIRASQTPVGSRPVENVLYIHESRRAKSRFGKGRSKQTQHPSNRYEYVLSELQALWRGSSEEQKLAEHVLGEVRSLRHGGTASEWAWLQQVLPGAGPGTRRPVSCGQYDVLSLVLDVLRTEAALLKDQNLQPYVILDNPEAFLHPALQAEVIDWIVRRLPTAQLLIATHSLKLLARATPASVFWLSREAGTADGRVEVQPVRDLAPSARGVFYELYGDDTSSVVFNLLLGLESSEYLAFLCSCALPCQPILRREPIEQDIQVQALIDEFRHFAGPWTLIDVGAGAGDLLVGIERLGIANPALEYLAVEAQPSDRLTMRLGDARDAGRIAPSSRVVTSMDDAPESCDAVVLANVCHAVGYERLAEMLAAALTRLRPSPSSRCVVHEVETLQRGERSFVMWTPADYAKVFVNLPGVKVEERTYSREIGVPIHTAILQREEMRLPEDLHERIRAELETLLPLKLQTLLARRNALGAEVDAEPHRLSRALLQRQYAFVSEQCTNLVAVIFEKKLVELPKDQNPARP